MIETCQCWANESATVCWACVLSSALDACIQWEKEEKTGFGRIYLVVKGDRQIIHIVLTVKNNKEKTKEGRVHY